MAGGKVYLIFFFFFPSTQENYTAASAAGFLVLGQWGTVVDQVCFFNLMCAPAWHCFCVGTVQLKSFFQAAWMPFFSNSPPTPILFCIDSWGGGGREGCLKRKGRQSEQNEELSLPLWACRAILLSCLYIPSTIMLLCNHMFPLLHYSYWGGGRGGRERERKPSRRDRGNKIP